VFEVKLGLVVSVVEPETVFNALRLANFSARQGDSVKVFLLGRGVELDQIQDGRFDVRAQARALLAAGGELLACGTCLKLRNSQGSELCPISTMKDLYELVRDSDRVVTF
jgi:sulfur relay (sulfurtransferase) complex TusBCD TusD component (DsrE family)